MKKNFPWNRFGQILYPLMVYYIVYNLAYTAMIALFTHKLSNLFCLGIASLLTIPFMYRMYQNLPIPKAQKFFEKQTFSMELFFVFLTVAFGILLNVFMTQLSFLGNSEGYARANETLYSGGTLTRIFATCICIPLLEELLYRGIICGQLGLWFGKIPAVVISALLFGVMHFNLVQFIYAFLVGIVLGMVYLHTQKVWIVFLAHGITNFIVVLWHIG